MQKQIPLHISLLPVISKVMESVITVDMKSFLFSNLIQGHSTLDMLLLLTQQWMEALNIRHQTRAISLDISHALKTVWHPALLSELSADGIQGQLHTCLTDILHSHSQYVALNRILPSPLPVKIGVS